MKINKNKNIGQVLFVVEGEKYEFSLLRRIFCNVLGYSMLQVRTGELPRFVPKQPQDPHVNIAVMHAPSSSTTSLFDAQSMDAIFEELIKKNFQVHKSAIFFLFDRDPKSHTKERCAHCINVFQDPYDNGNMQAGLMLLSYPSIGAHTISHFDDISEMHCALGSETKTYIQANPYIQFNKMTEETFKKASTAFLAFIKQTCEKPWHIECIPHFNQESFSAQEAHYDAIGRYKLFSMLIAAFLYLGIIDVET